MTPKYKKDYEPEPLEKDNGWFELETDVDDGFDEYLQEEMFRGVLGG